jgi:hypothetical protein
VPHGREKQQGPVHCWRGLGFTALDSPQAATPRPADGGRGGTGEVQRAKVHAADHAGGGEGLSTGVLSEGMGKDPVGQGARLTPEHVGKIESRE